MLIKVRCPRNGAWVSGPASRGLIWSRCSRHLLALLLAMRGVLSWTAVDTCGRLNRMRSEFLLAPRRLTRERPLVQVQHGPLTSTAIRRRAVIGYK